MKLLFFAIVLAVCAAGVYSNNLNQCPDPTIDSTVVVEHYEVVAPSTILNFGVQKQRRSYPYSGTYPAPITCILIRDNTNGGATPTITAGGVGFPTVEIQIKSRPLNGLNFEVEIHYKVTPPTTAATAPS